MLVRVARTSARASARTSAPASAPASARASCNASSSLTPDSVNPNLLQLEYAVRGPLLVRAIAIQEEIAKGQKKAFKRVIQANIGDAHAMGQRPMTFIRQVMALVSHPPLMQCVDFPEDVKQRATDILCAFGGGSAGAYTASLGTDLIRQHVAEYISLRDGQSASAANVSLHPGASNCIKSLLELFSNTSIHCKPSGVMVPIPQYPLYSATLAEFGINQCPYNLDEDTRWGLDEQELERAIAEAACSSAVRAIVIINPGNPTGQVLPRGTIQMIIKFARRHRLLIIADEVYQDNVYDPCSKFHSFKQVVMEMGEPYCSQQELASMMSASKGFLGECGIRGGWMEVVNIDPIVHQHLYTSISAQLCPTTLGQTAVDCLAKPPVCGEPSFPLWQQEKTDVLTSLAERAKLIETRFNEIDGYSCNPVQGSMYAFPQFKLTKKAIAAAQKAKQQPDMYYAFNMLEAAGICVVPGSGFGQKPGTHHYRVTILPPVPLLNEMCDRLKEFHKHFIKEYNV